MYYHNGKVFIEEEDQCQTCTNFTRGVACPLIYALGLGVVTLQDNLYVTNCGFYEEFKRNLRLIEKNSKDSNDDNTDSEKKIKRQ